MIATHNLAFGGPEFTALFDSFEHEAFRLEVLQQYVDDGEAEPLGRFLAGEQPQMYPGKERWIARVREATDAGKVMSRVHVVVEPLTDYLRYEVGWSYGFNVEAGEDIRILPVPAGRWPTGLPREDYWLFDSSTLARMRYDSDGRMVAVVLDEDPSAIARACAWRDLAMHSAVPYDQYLAGHRSLLQHAS